LFLHVELPRTITTGIPSKNRFFELLRLKSEGILEYSSQKTQQKLVGDPPVFAIYFPTASRLASKTQLIDFPAPNAPFSKEI
jgi:hypothetical protein